MWARNVIDPSMSTFRPKFPSCWGHAFSFLQGKAYYSFLCGTWRSILPAEETPVLFLPRSRIPFRWRIPFNGMKRDASKRLRWHATYRPWRRRSSGVRWLESGARSCADCIADTLYTCVQFSARHDGKHGPKLTISPATHVRQAATVQHPQATASGSVCRRTEGDADASNRGGFWKGSVVGGRPKKKKAWGIRIRSPREKRTERGSVTWQAHQAARRIVAVTLTGGPQDGGTLAACVVGPERQPHISSSRHADTHCTSSGALLAT